MSSLERRWLLLVFCGWLAFLGAYFQSVHLHVQMFRAESGMYLDAANRDAPERLAFGRRYVTSAYSGHFTPFAFSAELLQSTVFGTREALWFWRQIAAIALLATALSALVRRVLGESGAPPGWRTAGAIGAGAVFVLQPVLIELLAWPFMALQLVCVALAAFALERLLSFAESLRTATLGVALMLAYATMHACGVGAALSAAAIAVGAGLVLTLAPSRPSASDRRSAWIWLAAALGLTLLHTALMASMDGAGPFPVDDRPPAPNPPTLAVGGVELIKRFGWLFIGSGTAGSRSLWAGASLQWPSLRGFGSDAFYGLALLAIAVLGVKVGWWRLRRENTAQARFAWTLATFPVVGLMLYVAMIVFRLRSVPARDVVVTYLVGSRYLVFAALFLFVLLLAGFRAVVPQAGKLSTVVCVILGLGALAGNHSFVKQVMPEVWPWTQVHQETVWRGIVETARQELADTGAIRDRSLADLDLEFQMTLHNRRHILEHDLGCHGCARFAAPSK